MNAEDIRRVMGECGAGPWDGALVVDREYQHPSKDWFFGTFANAMQANLQSLGVWDYAEQENDCDDFSAITRALAQVMNHRTGSEAGHEKGKALAVGEFLYTIGGDTSDEAKGHAINCAIILHEGKPSLVFMEPQTGKQVYLSEKEIQSCNFFRF